MNRIFFYVAFFVCSFSIVMNSIALTYATDNRPDMIGVVFLSLLVLSLVFYIKDKDGLY